MRIDKEEKREMLVLAGAVFKMILLGGMFWAIMILSAAFLPCSL